MVYRRNSSPGDIEDEYLIETCRCNAHKEAVDGELIAHREGVYTLQFDNTASR